MKKTARITPSVLSSLSFSAFTFDYKLGQAIILANG